MKIAQVFQAVEETQFLKQLAFQDRIFLIGEAEILNYLQSFWQKIKVKDNNYYYTGSLQSLSATATNINQYRAVVVASFTDEASLFLEVKQKIGELKLNIVTLRLFADVFTNLICKRELLQPTVDRYLKPQKSYAILTTPRSGSTYLCNLLDSTGIAGYPTEHLRLAAQELASNCNFDYLRLLDNLMQYRQTSNGVFGTKLISHFLFQLRQTKYDFKQIFQPIDRFILLSRASKVAQAVSLVVAQKTEVWHLTQNNSQGQTSDLSYKSKLANIEIDDHLLAEVEQKRQFLIEQEARLNNILARNNIQPLQIVYEDIVENPQKQIDLILNFLEISPPQNRPIVIESQVKKKCPLSYHKKLSLPLNKEKKPYEAVTCHRLQSQFR